MRTICVLIPLAFLIGVSCRDGAPLTETERAQIQQSVDSTVRAFADAERARDAERVMAFVSPSFYMYSDGTRLDYATVSTQIRESMPTMEVFETVWEPLQVTVLGRDHALVSFTFRDSVVFADGNLLQVRGPTTLVWEREGPDWLLIYADADHYPIPPP